MNLKQKFTLLAGISGAIMAIISIIGYYTAYTNLDESVESEIALEVRAEGEALNGWLMEKGLTAQYAANVRTAMGGNYDPDVLSKMIGTATEDKDILDLTAGDEKGISVGHHDGNLTGEYDARTRDWYKDAKSLGKLFFTDVYQDDTTKQLVVSAATPFFENGQFAGAICADITLDVLDKRAETINYRGHGLGYIIDTKGRVLASDDEKCQRMSNFSEMEGIGTYWQEIDANHAGHIDFKDSSGNKIFAYTTLESTGWVVGVIVDEDFALEPVAHMRLTYGILTLVGIALSVFACLRMSTSIVGAVEALDKNASEMSKGNLTVQELPVTTNDEIGGLTKSFNTMSKNIRKLITNMANTAEQVAAASEELTATASHSANSSQHVAATVSEVTVGMEQQLSGISQTKDEVNAVFVDISSVADKAKSVGNASTETANAAQQGAQLMEDAISRMKEIEKRVIESAQMVRELGKSSEEIGEIIGAISSISDQTNLLALNAAIEAARAGEAGRGFAVVAEEVRKLATETQESAEEIRDRIASIQASTKHTVDAMEKGTEEVVAGTKAIQDVGVQFSDILAMVDDIQKQIHDINVSVKTVSDGANNIVGAVEQINNISRNTTESTKIISTETEEQSASNEEIATASKSLANLAQEMQESINIFKI